MTFVLDHFSDTGGTSLVDHVGEVGANWTSHPGAAGAPPEISDSNELRRGGHTDVALCYASGVPPSADYQVIADFLWVPSDMNCWAGITARFATDSYDGYVLQYEQWMGSRGWVLYSVVAGSFTALQSAPASSPGTAILRLEADAITVSIDGVPTLAATNSDHVDAGLVGVRFDPGDGADAIWLDNLHGTDLTAPPLPTGQLWPRALRERPLVGQGWPRA